MLRAALFVLAALALSSPAAHAGPGTPAFVRVTVDDTLIVRWHPRAPSDVIARVDTGTTLEALDEDNGYYWIIAPRDEFGTRRAGWIDVRRVEAVPAPARPAAAPALAAAETPAAARTQEADRSAEPVRTIRSYAFEDLIFDRDRATLAPDATRILDRAAITLNDDRMLRLMIEGHTCSLGSPAYNLALGERRATAVRDYLIGRGVAADRLDTVSVGEERPAHDNAQEATRQLNRRVVLVPRAQP